MSPSIIFYLYYNLRHTSEFEDLKKLLDKEFIIIKRVKLLFHLFLDSFPVIQ